MISLLLLASGAFAGDRLPDGWILAGSAVSDYRALTVDEPVHDGARAVRIESRTDKTDGFATVMQRLFPEDLRGERIRVTGWLKTEGAEGWAGVWARVDTAEKRAHAFDNMQDRALKGTVDWTRCEVVLDVTEEANNLSFGALLSGPGVLWLDEFSVEVVDDSVPVTDFKSTRARKPTNLDFE